MHRRIASWITYQDDGKKEMPDNFEKVFSTQAAVENLQMSKEKQGKQKAYMDK